MLEELAHLCIALAGKVLGMELYGHDGADRIGLNDFGDAIGRPSGNFQAGSQLFNALVVLGVYLDATLTHQFANHTSRNKIHIVSHFTMPRTMVYFRGVFAWDVLIEGAAHGYIDKLKATTDT